MTPIEKQMLKNQLVIMGCFKDMKKWEKTILKEIDYTRKLFEDEGEIIREPCCKMPEEDKGE